MQKQLWYTLRRYKRRLFQLVGVRGYSHPAAPHIDAALERHLAYRNGFFIEAGANDGFTQSNTYRLEKEYGWHGVLVEPLPYLYEECRRARRRARVFNCALVPFDYADSTVPILDSNLMSVVKGARKSESEDWAHARQGEHSQHNVTVSERLVPARTLTSILNEVGIAEIDLLSLDVEGYELPALQGLDLHRYRPKFILVEANYRAEIDAYLSAWYSVIEDLGGHDVLYRRNEDR